MAYSVKIQSLVDAFDAGQKAARPVTNEYTVTALQDVWALCAPKFQDGFTTEMNKEGTRLNITVDVPNEENKSDRDAQGIQVICCAGEIFYIKSKKGTHYEATGRSEVQCLHKNFFMSLASFMESTRLAVNSFG